MSSQIPTNAFSSSSLPPTRTTTLTSFMTSFYSTSDNPTAHDEYARDYFTADAVLIMGGKRADGFDEILSLRKALWTSVSSRKHTVSKIFFGGEHDMMIYGRVAYVMKGTTTDGVELELDWAARVEFDDDEKNSSLKMKFYQVYLDTAAQQAAAQKKS